MNDARPDADAEIESFVASIPTPAESRRRRRSFLLAGLGLPIVAAAALFGLDAAMRAVRDQGAWRPARIVRPGGPLPTQLRYLPDGERLFVDQNDRAFELDPATGAETASHASMPGTRRTVGGLGGRLVAVEMHATGAVRVVDWRTGARLGEWTWPGDASAIEWMCFGHDDGPLLVADASQSVTVCDPLTGAVRFRLQSPPGEFLGDAAVSRGGTLLAQARRNAPLQTWDPRSGERLQSLPASKERRTTQFLRDERRLLTLEDGEIALFDARTGDELRRFRAERGRVRCLALSIDERWLAAVTEETDRGVLRETLRTVYGERAASYGGRVMLWDLESGERVAESVAMPEWIECVAFAPDGRRLASVDYAGRIAEWDVAFDSP